MAEAAPNIFAKKYEILSKLGQGNFAAVYLAKDITLGRKVAVKVLNPQLSQDDHSFLLRFEREAQTIAQLNHPHIIDVYEFGQENGRYFFVMPYLPGADLASLIKRQCVMEIEQVLPIAEQVGAALDYAHSRGVIHRDVKPSNVILNEHGQAILTDFGIVKLVDETTGITSKGSVFGTPHYMAPEQWDTGEIDARTDLYALGVMIYQILTGQVPFPGEVLPRIINGHLNATPPLPHILNPALPAAVDRVLLKMLAKSPEQRYQTAGEFCADLRVALTKRSAEGGVQRGKWALGSSKVAWLGGGIALVAALILGVLLIFFPGGGGGNPTTTPPSLTASERAIAQVTPAPLMATPEPPTSTPTPEPTDTSVPEPTDTSTPQPTDTSTLTATPLPTPTRTLTPWPTGVPTPSIPIYDDFADGILDRNKWGPPSGGNPQSYIPRESQGKLRFEIADKWIDWMIPDTRSVREFDALVTLEQAKGGAIGFTMGSYKFRYGLSIRGDNQIMITGSGNLPDLFESPGRCCPSTHLLGAKADGQQMHFYIDGNLILSYPFSGYPNLTGLQIIADGPTSAHISGVWVDFSQ